MMICPFCREENNKTNSICSKCGSIINDNISFIKKGTLLDNRYEIVEHVGKGGMGSVYKAVDLKLNNSIVAIKEMIVQGIPEERLDKAIESFKKEASLLIELRHHALPRVIDFFSEGYKKWYLVMDFIDGENLDKVIKERGQLPEMLVIHWLKQLCSVLHYLHTNEPSIIFRDLKPSNIMVTDKNKIVLIDFGIAKHLESTIPLDATWSFSPGFSPPEQILKNEIGFFTDIYSLGLVLYNLLTGIDPSKIKNYNFEEPKKIIDISDTLNDAIMKCISTDPNNRPQSIRELQNLVFKKNSSKKKKKYNKYAPAIGFATIIILTLLILKFPFNKLSFKASNKYYDLVSTFLNTKDAPPEIDLDKDIDGEIENNEDTKPTQTDFLINNNSKMQIAMEDEIFYEASPALTYKIAELLNNSYKIDPSKDTEYSNQIKSKNNNYYDYIIRIQGFQDIFINLGYTDSIYFENSDEVYITKENVQKIFTLIYKDEKDSNIYKWNDTIILQTEEEDLDNDSIKEKIQLIYNNNIELLIDDSRVIVIGDYWHTIDYNLQEMKFNLFKQNNNDITNIIVTVNEFANKIGSSEEIFIYYYENGTINKIWDLSNQYDPKIYSIVHNDIVNISIPEFEYSKNLAKDYIENFKEVIVGDKKLEGEEVFYVGTHMYSEIVDTNNDGIDELVMVRTFGGPLSYLEGVCKTYYLIDGLEVKATGIKIEALSDL